MRCLFLKYILVTSCGAEVLENYFKATKVN
jgi:hypothetical protein